MAAAAREAGSLKSAVAAVEQELSAEPELPAARQEMAGLDNPAVLAALEPSMLEGAVVTAYHFPMIGQAMVVSAAEALEV
jgi:hypothetical protein